MKVLNFWGSLCWAVFAPLIIADTGSFPLVQLSSFAFLSLFEKKMYGMGFLSVWCGFPVLTYHPEGYTLYGSLAYPPALCPLPVGAKGKQSLKLLTPLLCVFFCGALNPLGDSVGPAFGLHMVPLWWLGVLRTLRCLQGFLSVCVYRTPCLTIFINSGIGPPSESLLFG